MGRHMDVILLLLYYSTACDFLKPKPVKPGDPELPRPPMILGIFRGSSPKTPRNPTTRPHHAEANAELLLRPALNL